MSVDIVDEDDNEDVDSNWNFDDFGNVVFEEDSSDYDELEYDSDEGTNLQLVAGDYTSRRSGGNLSEERKELPLWSLDEDESFLSDWTIEVSVDGESKKLYHVHKFTLATGPMKSEYFETLFKSGQFSESADSTSIVPLPEDVAAFFPDFLDYMYSQPSECDRLINRENRRSLQHLASYFLVPKLTEAIYNFIQEDMHDLEHLEEYVSEFGGAEDDESRKVLSIAARVCAERILDIEGGSSLLTALTPAMVLHMFCVVRMSKDVKSVPPSTQHHICRLALVYMKHHQTRLDTGFFNALASELRFPDDTDLARDVAITLLEIMKLSDWKDEYIKWFCTDLLSRSLANIEPTVSKIAAITEKVPRDALTVLLAEALIAKKTLTTETFNNVSCEIVDDCGGKSLGNVQISFKSTDSINYIKYLIGRSLGIMMGDCGTIRVFCEGECLEGHKIISNCAISSTTLLEVKAPGWFPAEDDGPDD
eukprot:CAMPEP_0172332202 /NCGR_PEP_ID=MMETSP1058-20130122/62317_1 /TAXON_ID=83371 /ORGANISM="Detonula confervacea, Strain CCMP 353" /LENGTH=477 /DNA_ID=CAMNT_0013049479 /DNA_START=9 /DNA_END=1442 /DNA_ORIENTATION=+